MSAEGVSATADERGEATLVLPPARRQSVEVSIAGGKKPRLTVSMPAPLPGYPSELPPQPPAARTDWSGTVTLTVAGNQVASESVQLNLTPEGTLLLVLPCEVASGTADRGAVRMRDNQAAWAIPALDFVLDQSEPGDPDLDAVMTGKMRDGTPIEVAFQGTVRATEILPARYGDPMANPVTNAPLPEPGKGRAVLVVGSYDEPRLVSTRKNARFRDAAWVARIELEQVKSGSCGPYAELGAATLDKMRADTTVTVHELATGRQVGSRTFKGGAVRCPATVPAGRTAPERGEIAWAPIDKWLKGISR